MAVAQVGCSLEGPTLAKRGECTTYSVQTGMSSETKKPSESVVEVWRGQNGDIHYARTRQWVDQSSVNIRGSHLGWLFRLKGLQSTPV